MQLVGIDCASRSENTGIAIGDYKDGKIWLSKVIMGNKKESIANLLTPLLDISKQVVFAFDAPLGWSEPMGRLLAKHQAGEPIEEQQDRFFRRLTDSFVHQVIGKLPLEVGADRIARTAHSALKIISDLRMKGFALTMLWKPDTTQLHGLLEVYPSATLKGYGMVSSAYKGDTQEEKKKRQNIIKDMQSHIPNILDFINLDSKSDMLDAVICLLCAKDFLEGKVYLPINMEIAKKEGWIWVRRIDNNIG
jgi:predicted RNase H-like nuclease